MGYVVYDEHMANDVDAGHDLFIHYGQIEHPRIGKVGVIAELVGKTVCECLDKYDVPYDWDMDRGKLLILGEYLRGETK